MDLCYRIIYKGDNITDRGISPCLCYFVPPGLCFRNSTKIIRKRKVGILDILDSLDIIDVLDCFSKDRDAIKIKVRVW